MWQYFMLLKYRLCDHSPEGNSVALRMWQLELLVFWPVNTRLPDRISLTVTLSTESCMFISWVWMFFSSPVGATAE